MLKKYGYHDLDGGRGGVCVCVCVCVCVFPCHCQVMIILPVMSHTTCYESYYLLRVIPSITVLKHSTMLKKYGYHDLDGGRGVFPRHCSWNCQVVVTHDGELASHCVGTVLLHVGQQVLQQ